LPPETGKVPEVNLIQALQLGRVPRVVGTIITSDYLRAWSANPSPLPCDLVEFRLDGFSDFPDWLKIAIQIEHQGTPVFVTVRLKREGGLWAGSDLDRWPLLEPAIRHLSGVDVEVMSDLARGVAELAGQLGKLSVFSYHNFETTPAEQELEGILAAGHRLGGIGKIAVTVNAENDLNTLVSLLGRKWSLPICIIGMGPLGRETRLNFPLQGSCFTYGYLDTPGAPGQYSAAELTSHFSTLRRAGKA
jgi:3-dehydroquinate dehydratase I